jgi:hypothetical protein
MCSTTGVPGRPDDRVDGDGLVEHRLGLLAAEPLEALGDAALSESVSRLQRLETMVAAESCGASPRSTPVRPGGPRDTARPPTSWRAAWG